MHYVLAQSDLVPASTTTNKVQRLKAVDAEGNISNITLYTCDLNLENYLHCHLRCPENHQWTRNHSQCNGESDSRRVKASKDIMLSLIVKSLNKSWNDKLVL
ncbi:hypothetical protein QQP08_002318, partial [Theobroma cacao]